jgi:hypothetical protein
MDRMKPLYSMFKLTAAIVFLALGTAASAGDSANSYEAGKLFIERIASDREVTARELWVLWEHLKGKSLDDSDWAMVGLPGNGFGPVPRKLTPAEKRTIKSLAPHFTYCHCSWCARQGR